MFTLRNANLDDIDMIMEIEKQSFIPQIQEEKKTFIERIEVFAPGFIIVEDIEKNPFGYMCTELWSSFDFDNCKITGEIIDELKNKLLVGHSIKSVHLQEGKNLYISSFAINKEMRGKGFGKKIFEESINFIKKRYVIEKMFLLVNSEWIGAQKIYTDFGFKKIFDLPEMFYKDDHCFSDGIVMVKGIEKNF